MIDKIDEFGNRVEYIKSDLNHDDQTTANGSQEDFNEFRDDAKKKFDRIQFENKATRGGQKAGKGARSLIEFAGDSLGLLILKNQGNKKLAKTIIKGGRSAGETVENIFGKVFNEGGKVMGQAAEKVDMDLLLKKAEDMKNQLSQTVKPGEIKNKLSEAFQKIEEMIQEIKSDVQDSPEKAEKKRADLEAKIAAFEKLYEEETTDWEIHSSEGYKPEEIKETCDKY